MRYDEIDSARLLPTPLRDPSRAAWKLPHTMFLRRNGLRVQTTFCRDHVRQRRVCFARAQQTPRSPTRSSYDSPRTLASRRARVAPSNEQGECKLPALRGEPRSPEVSGGGERRRPRPDTQPRARHCGASWRLSRGPDGLEGCTGASRWSAVCRARTL
ncbi:hypothetical protein C8Q79DRAFT_376671 [Trametes meyenii]|nr:hypothetical protein C8Q79DRAFT_376671 [Trametes meyenii]